MNNVDAFLTVDDVSTGEYKEKASKFLAYCYPLEREDQLHPILTSLKSEHPKANHHCYAYKIGRDNNRFRTYDDGEPSGTAGKPIFGQILSHNLTNILIVVVRYFGGTKLGVSGLIHAYKQAAIEGLKTASVVEKFVCINFRLEFTYEHMGLILAALKDLNIEIVEKTFDHQCIVIIEMRKSEAENKLKHLKSKLLAIS